ncbi:hypothetical protein [uncultured Algibacter sp.]|uniref:hypothetical protein n=1 Tax=uncultured Algibacter sp. TaxID=298659 RepID=UPI00321781EE
MKNTYIIILILFLTYSCKTTYYLSPYLTGQTTNNEKKLNNVEIGFLNEGVKYISNKEGRFEIPQKKTRKAFGAPNMKFIRLVNSPILIFKKPGFINDTIDIRNFEYNRSIFISDTINLGIISLKKLN